LDALERVAVAEKPRLDVELARREAEQLKHHWGVPLMVLDDEPFFGQDRLDALAWRMDGLGLRRA
ncbi:MAG: hypothetical protein K2Q06_16245, partial [Parvularculaceae bacterium]|nr:hypothetical protein [Parvularculaceae bacterium]